MNNNSGKGIRSRYFKTFWVMLLTFTLVIPCLNGIRIQVHADDTATVWKIYGRNTNNGPIELELVSGDATVADKDLIGKFITGGNYALIEEDRDKLIIADNAAVTAGNVDVGEFKLSGNSSLIYADFTLSSTESRFTPYAVSQGAITISGLQAHYEAEGTPYFVDPDRQIWSRSYDLTVNGDFMLAGNPKFDDQNRPVLDEEGHQIIDGNWMGYNDIHVLSGGHIYVEDRGYLLVEGSLTVDAGGTVTGSGNNHYLRVCDDASVTGLPLYAGTDSNNVSDRFDGDLHALYEFRYDNTSSKWIYPFDLDARVFRFSIGGFDKDNERITVQYKYSAGESYTAVTPVMTNYEGDTANYGISLNNCPDNATSVYLKIDFTPAAGSNKIFACWSSLADRFNFRDDGISVDLLTLEYAFNINDEIEISLNYPNSGEPGIIDTANDYLYAYTGANEATIKTYLATELYNRFIEVAMYQDFGLKRITNDDRDIELTARITELASRITVTGSQGSISATAKDGTSVTIPVNNYKVSWGYNGENGDPIESDIPVYTLPDAESFLICTDFNKNTGAGSTFYIRKAHSDEIPFDGTANDAIPVIVPSINPDKIVIGGMGADTTVQNTDNIFAFNLNSRWLNANQNGPSTSNDPADYGTTVRLMIDSETYIVLNGDGETKSYGNVGNNGFGTDTVWNTRSDGSAEAMVYIGLTTLYLRPLVEATGVAVREITAVELADSSLSGGVHITPMDNGVIQITADSNFYSNIPLNITYSDGGTRKLKINRVGLVIQYMYLGGDPNQDSDRADSFDMGFDHRSDTIRFNYDYFAGEQIAVYGIYYTPTNDPTGGSSDLSLYLTFEDGTHRVVSAVNNDTLTLKGENNTISRGFNGKLSATNDSVATTVFLIGFALARDGQDPNDGVWYGNVTDTYYEDQGRRGFYASVLNAGWDDDENFGGTQVGSGKGIHWDGHITWY